MSISCAHCAVYFCGIQNVYELQKFLARDVNKKQRRQNCLTVTTSAMVGTTTINQIYMDNFSE